MRLDPAPGRQPAGVQGVVGELDQGIRHPLRMLAIVT